MPLDKAADHVKLDRGELDWAMENHGRADTDEHIVTPSKPGTNSNHLSDADRAHSGKPGMKVRHGNDATGRYWADKKGGVDVAS